MTSHICAFCVAHIPHTCARNTHAAAIFIYWGLEYLFILNNSWSCLKIFTHVRSIEKRPLDYWFWPVLHLFEGQLQWDRPNLAEKMLGDLKKMLTQFRSKKTTFLEKSSFYFPCFWLGFHEKSSHVMSAQFTSKKSFLQTCGHVIWLGISFLSAVNPTPTKIKRLYFLLLLRYGRIINSTCC